MQEVSINEIKPGAFFTEDSFIFDYLFFLPKKTLIKEYHIEVMKMWNVENILTSGTLVTEPRANIQEKSTDLVELFDTKENLIKLPDDENSDSESVNKSSESEAVSTEVSESNSITTNDSYKTVYKRWIMSIVSFFNSILTTKDVNKQNVINLLNDIESFIKRDRDSVLLLLGQDMEGLSRVYRQSLDTVILSFIMSHSLNLSDFAKTNLVLGTLFHDIGMFKIPKAILEKKGELSQDDIKVIQNHTVIGFNYIREARYSAIIASGALQHHERVDGKGYPERKSSEQITNIGKIVAVLDAYSAAISSKPFRSPVHAKEAVQDLLKLGGTAYDTGILKEFVKNISIYPVGSMILLSNNLPGKVVGNSGVSMRPIIVVLNNGKEERIDLSKRADVYIKGVYVKKTAV